VSNLLAVAKDWAGGPAFAARRHLSWLLLSQFLELELQQLQSESAQTSSHSVGRDKAQDSGQNRVAQPPPSKRVRRDSSSSEHTPAHELIVATIKGSELPFPFALSWSGSLPILSSAELQAKSGGTLKPSIQELLHIVRISMVCSVSFEFAVDSIWAVQLIVSSQDVPTFARWVRPTPRVMFRFEAHHRLR
jgi:hypothetical protein